VGFMINLHQFKHWRDDLGIGHVFEINGRPIRILTKPSLLEMGIHAFDDIVMLLLKLDEAVGFVE